MTVPTIPSSISLVNIQTEFGGSNPIAINEYYAGGSYVSNPTANSTGTNIPTSGTIAFSNFSGATAVTVPPVSVLDRNVADTVYGGQANAWARFNSNGLVQGTLNEGAFTWLNSGSAGSYDISQTKTGGNYGTGLSGMTNATWYVLSTTRTMYLLDPIAGNYRDVYTDVKIKYNANSTVIDSNNWYFYAWGKNTACTFCCLTPETLIAMATGDFKKIKDIVIGDVILTRNGPKAVTEIITRDYRRMYEFTFADGRTLNISDDHPVYVRDKGYSCVNPMGEYKDMGIPDKLEAGDFVQNQDGSYNELISIREIYYPWTVYTFAETEFYANGILVY
jgi:hypothetical protein